MTTLTLTPEKAARHRVAKSNELWPHWDTLIIIDWPNRQEHLEWVATAPIAEILEWCEAVEEA